MHAANAPLDPNPAGENGPPLPVYVGCAGWGIASGLAARFPTEGSHLQRYARVLPAVEINSSFYRPHQAKTYARWAASVPDGFRFSVKLPRLISHERRLRDVLEPMRSFLEPLACLGDTLLDALATRIVGARQSGKQVWCIFDNTANGHALPNALALMERLSCLIPASASSAYKPGN